MIIDWSKKLKFERFVLPGEIVTPSRKIEGLKKGKSYEVLQYVPDKVLLKNKKGVNTWYKAKHFKLN